MNINIKATNTTLTDAITTFIEDKLAHVGKFLKNDDKVFVELGVDKKHKSGQVFRAEVSINPPKFYAESQGSDLYEALDLVVPKIKEQLLKAKDKKVSQKRRGK